MTKALVSILMPVYNEEQYLTECIDSIIGQSFKDWELIAVDDMSTDSSLEILTDFNKRDNRIKPYSNRHKGIIPSLDLAFKMSTAAWITRMDADDLMPQLKIDCLLDLAREKGKGHVATGKVKYFVSEGKVGGGYQQYQDWLNVMIDQKSWWDEIYKECPIASPNWLMHRDDLIKIGAFEAGRYPEDYDLVFRMRKGGMKVVSTESITHLWRDHSERTSRNHEHYSNNAFLDLKWSWFKVFDYDPSCELVLWGAGKKGKGLARLVQQSLLPFEWITDNEKKWGREVHGKIWKDTSIINSSKEQQVIVVVAQPEELLDIKKTLSSIATARPYFFC